MTIGKNMKVFAEYKYIIIVCRELRLGAKTLLYYVHNRKSNGLLGHIRWYSPWRQYCFLPIASTIWSDGCLEDIHDALKRIAGDYKMDQGKRKLEVRENA